ncbi:MAG TPA: protein-L-isoaspartate(D-aspartate) O-methyltransferase, partial [Pirellulales bacterium]|nr:protein-L-isoaspartate(D-aspartate) O-methyltransferase [Pirellulales bacterium]
MWPLVLGMLLLVNSASAQAPTDSLSATDARRRMVDKEIVGAGVKDSRVIEAMRATPRHEFVNFKDRALAYLDMALPIGEGQTISPPFIVAYMTEQLESVPSDRVLEIGTGSGYQAAVLSPLVKEVYTIEIKEALGQHAARTLKRLGYANVFPKIGDGFQGWPDKAPFDKVIVTCSPENVPKALVDQLREGGRLVIPLGERYQQTLYLFRKDHGKLVPEALRPTLFVPMTGTAEQQRKLKPDPLKPSIVNGSFEELAKEGDAVIPKGWHYVRQADVIEDHLSPDGERYLRFANKEPGRGSQALQGFAINSQKVPLLEVSLRVKGNGITPGQNSQQLPMLIIAFYDEKQNIVGERGIGPWR